jgi:hypothetical protein
MGKLGFICAIVALSFAATTTPVFAGTFEFSGGLSYSKSTFSDDSYEWNRRWGLSVGYYFFTVSEVELSFQDVTTRTKITGYQDTPFHDQIFSINWVQTCAPKDFPVQPYLKLGVGQLNRDAQGSYAGGAAPPLGLGQITVVLGVGLRVSITKHVALRGEGTSYLVGGSLKSWADNFGLTFGASFYY